MKPAIIDNISCCTALTNNRPKQSWGGARNKASRTSDCVTKYHAQNLMASFEHAAAIGLHLNRSITIHFGKLGIADADAGKVLSAFLKILGNRIATYGGRFACIWVRENGADKGSHAHIFAHIPASLWPMVKRRQSAWLHKASGKRLERGTLKGRKVRGSGDLNGDRALYAANGGNVARYLVKGVTSDVAAFLGLSKQGAQGVIIGKRSGTSQNIGATARGAA
jgi:hypothetical protein